jgi:potassium-transporting ATPase KdpC subunit
MKGLILHPVLRSIVFLGIFTVLVGLVYPAVVTGLAQVFFRDKANGSFLTRGGQTTGSSLIGQPFSDPKYFWGRLSATLSFEYNPMSSSGSNYGPLNPHLLEAVDRRVTALRGVDPGNDLPVPVDLVTFSASGLDPDISIAAADFQIARVARYRSLTVADIEPLVTQCTEGRQFGILGEPRVNVLRLNIALDELK